MSASDQLVTTMPHLTRPEAEAAFLACVLTNPAALDDGDRVALRPESFYQLKHRTIYEAMLALRQENQAVDYTAIVGELAQRKHLQDVGGAAGIALLTREQEFTPEHALTYATQIARSARLRNLIDFGAEVVKRANAANDNTASEEVLAWAEEALQHMNYSRRANAMLFGPDTIPFHDRLILAAMQATQRGDTVRYPWPSAWYTWQRHIMPLSAGEVGLLAAGTGIGKSTYLESIAESWAQAGRQVVLVHFEDNHEYKLNRRLSRYSGIPLADLKLGHLTESDITLKRRTETTMAGWIGRLHYLHTPGWSMAQVVRDLRACVDTGSCDAVVIDYLDKAQADTRQQKLFGVNIYERQADDMERIKSFAESAGVPIFTATQGNKSIDAAARATRQHIMGSGQKSHKAQLVLVLNREIVEADEAKVLGVSVGSYSPIVTVRIDKQNQGDTLEFRQRLDGPRFRIFDLENDNPGDSPRQPQRKMEWTQR